VDWWLPSALPRNPSAGISHREQRLNDNLNSRRFVHLEGYAAKDEVLCEAQGLDLPRRIPPEIEAFFARRIGCCAEDRRQRRQLAGAAPGSVFLKILITSQGTASLKISWRTRQGHRPRQPFWGHVPPSLKGVPYP
jgi:hypothetical protein